jgi:hypothetical protein
MPGSGCGLWAARSAAIAPLAGWWKSHGGQCRCRGRARQAPVAIREGWGGVTGQVAGGAVRRRVANSHGWRWRPAAGATVKKKGERGKEEEKGKEEEQEVYCAVARTSSSEHLPLDDPTPTLVYTTVVRSLITTLIW